MTEASLDLSAIARAGKPMANSHRHVPPADAIFANGIAAI
jgi:hypothetical protein